MLKKIRSFLSKKDVAKKLFSASRIFSGKVVGITSGLIINFIVARNYGVASIGEYSLFLSFIDVTSMMLLLGVNGSILKQLPELNVRGFSRTSAVKGSLKLLTIAQLIFFVPAYILILWNDTFFLNDPFSFFPLILIAGVILKSLKEFFISTSRGFMHIWPYAIGRGSMNFFIMLILLFGIISKNYWHPNKIIVAALLIDAVLYGVYVVRLIKGESNNPNLKSNPSPNFPIKGILADSIPLYYTTLINFITLQGGIYFLRFFHSIEDVSFYAMASRYAFIVNMIYMTIKGYTSPLLAKFNALNDRKGLLDEAKKSTKLISLFSFPLALLLILVTPYLLKLHGKEFVVSYGPFLIILSGLLIKVVFGAGDNFLNMTGHHSSMRGINLISFVVFVILNLLLNPTYSYYGAAVSFTFAIFIRHILCAMKIRKLYNDKIGYI